MALPLRNPQVHDRTKGDPVLNEKALRETLLNLVRIIKSQTEVYASLTIELAATKETLRALDPSFDDTLTKKRHLVEQSISLSVVGLIGTLDLLTQRLTSGEVC